MRLISPTDYFVHPIYWKNPVVYRRKHICSITKSVIGKEQRSVLNTLVRRELQFSIHTRNQSETYHFKSHVRLYLHQVWGVPLWFYEMSLFADASGTTLNVDSTQYRELVAGQRVILVTDYDTYEVGVINTFDTISITLTSSLTTSWSSGTKVYPVVSCEMQDFQDISYPYKELVLSELSFIESFRVEHTTTTTTTTTSSSSTTTTTT